MKDWKGWVVVILGAIALVLSLVNVNIYSDNRELQANVASRQQVIVQATQLRQLNSSIIETLARLAADTNDANIRQLLADYGVTYSVNEEMPAPNPNESAEP